MNKPEPGPSRTDESDQVFELARRVFRVMSRRRVKIISSLIRQREERRRAAARIDTRNQHVAAPQARSTSPACSASGARVQIYYRIIDDRVATCAARCT